MNSEYCCIWCHTALAPEQTYVNEKTGSTVCERHRGLGIVLTEWKHNCQRQHKYDPEHTRLRASIARVVSSEEWQREVERNS